MRGWMDAFAYKITNMKHDLRTLRQDRGFTGPALAAAVGVHYSSISRIERGLVVPGVRVAMRIAEVLGVPVDAIEWADPSEVRSA